LKKEAAAAAKVIKHTVEASDSDEEFHKKPKNKKEKAKQDHDDEFDKATGDINDQLEANFEGVAKKNTRKKKEKNTNIYEAGGQADLLAAFYDGAESDEVLAKKGGKNKKDR
jgi:hypothetical protein